MARIREDSEWLNICPFSDTVIRNEKKTEGEETVYLVLFLHYLTLLCKQCQVMFSIPQMRVCLKKSACKRSTMYSAFSNQKEKMLKELLKDILVKSGWNYGKGILKEENVIDVQMYSSQNIQKQDWDEAVSQIPDILKLEQKGFRDISITVCWSERIARYCNYIVEHPKETKKKFQKEAIVLECILHKMEDPYAVGNPFSKCGEIWYVMGFFEGKNERETISFSRISYNFFVQAVILHVLLTKAEKIFELSERKRKTDEES